MDSVEILYIHRKESRLTFERLLPHNFPGEYFGFQIGVLQTEKIFSRLEIYKLFSKNMLLNLCTFKEFTKDHPLHL